MSERFRSMSCYILAGGKRDPQRDFAPSGDLTRLEKSYRRYAAIFENVKLIIKKSQARERYLNYPHVCDQSEAVDPAVGLKAAAKDAGSDAVFIGSSELFDFPLELPVNLIRNYDGETFLGYHLPGKEAPTQPLFGIYSKRHIEECLERNDGEISFEDLTAGGRHVPLPEGVDSSCIRF